MPDDSTSTYLDVYCERAGDPAIWAEPLNSITNLGFVIAAILLFLHWKKNSSLTVLGTADILILTLLIASIGIGSGLWHLNPNKMTLAADVLPITLFINLYLVVFLLRIFRLKWWQTTLAWLLFQSVNIATVTYLPADLFNGSVMYAPALLTLLLLRIISVSKKLPCWKNLRNASDIFLLSILLRSMDMQWCNASFGIGTHPLWHLLNAYTLYQLVLLLLLEFTHREQNKSTKENLPDDTSSVK